MHIGPPSDIGQRPVDSQRPPPQAMWARLDLWSDMRPVLITAGATRNPLDAMRYVSAFSSGGTGVWLSTALRACLGEGGSITLLGSAEALLRCGEIGEKEEFTSTRDLMARMERWVTQHPGGVIAHAAAVGDYEAQTHGGKLPSGQAELVLRLLPTPKIVDRLKVWDPGTFLVSFKAAPPETDQAALEQIARAQLRRTSSDLVFANVLGRIGTDVLLVDDTSARRFPQRADALDALLEAMVQAAIAA